MSSAYYPKNDATYKRSVKVQKLSIPFFIQHNATPANKVVTPDAPELLFLGVQGINNLTVASGAFDSSAEQSAITFASANDASGIFSLLVRVGEQVSKVMYVRISRRDGSEVVAGTAPTGASAWISSLGDKIVANVDSAVDLSAADGNYVLEVEYIAHE